MMGGSGAPTVPPGSRASPHSLSALESRAQPPQAILQTRGQHHLPSPESLGSPTDLKAVTRHMALLLSVDGLGAGVLRPWEAM